MGRPVASRLPRQADVSVMVCVFLEPLQKMDEREIACAQSQKCVQANATSATMQKWEYFEQESYECILRSDTPGITHRRACSLQLKRTKLTLTRSNCKTNP